MDQKMFWTSVGCIVPRKVNEKVLGRAGKTNKKTGEVWIGEGPLTAEVMELSVMFTPKRE